MAKESETKTEKLSGKQLVETIRDAIYEVLEEELDARLENLENLKKRKVNEQKAHRVKTLKEKKRTKATLESLQAKKERIKEAYKKLTDAEKKLLEKLTK